MKLIVGLGNPGRKYRDTKHNVGFICVDAYASKHGLNFTFDKKFQADIYKAQSFILLKPQTYMNLSGISVRSCLEYFNINHKDILVIHDDLDLPLSKLRLRYQGSDGGHKGLRSIFSSLENADIKRVKFGIGKHPDIEVKNYVLSKFRKAEIPEVKKSVERTVEVIEDFINNVSFTNIMNTYN